MKKKNNYGFWKFYIEIRVNSAVDLRHICVRHAIRGQNKNKEELNDKRPAAQHAEQVFKTIALTGSRSMTLQPYYNGFI